MKLFEEEELNKILKKIDNILEKKTVVYLIGGSAMIHHGAKTSTKDIDLVLNDEEDYQRLISALNELGYNPLKEKTSDYEDLKAKIVLDHPDNPRFDIFLNEVCGKLQLSSNMIDRCESIQDYDNLKINILSKEDIFLFKIVATRERDIDDASILFESGLDWQEILKETDIQSDITGRMWFPILNQCLEDMEKEYFLTSPVKEEVYKKAIEQLEENVDLE